MSKSRFKVNDCSHILVTDVLPYEIPIIFTNEGFMRRISRGKKPKILTDLIDTNNDKTPYKFKIKKGSNSFRELSIVHPSCQNKIKEYYSSYKHLIISLCTKSAQSLRAPSSISSGYYVQNNKKIRDEIFRDESVSINRSEEVDAFSSTFFTYRKYSFLYKFYDSYEFHRLEKKYRILEKLDIANCFDNITTEALSRVLKGDKYVSNNKGLFNFDSKFSALMTSMNGGSANGIVIGPEFSRIYAEILLQNIDSSLISRLKSVGLKIDADYTFRRYVDDYFVFSNEKNIVDIVAKTLEVILAEMKLYINNSKRQSYSTPFISKTSIAKNQIQKTVDSLFLLIDKPTVLAGKECYCSFSGDFKDKPHIVSNVAIKDLKISLESNGSNFSEVTGFLLSKIRNRLPEIKNLGYSAGFNKVSLYHFFRALIDIVFYVYLMDIRVRSTYLVSQITLSMLRLCSTLGLDRHHQMELSRRVFEEIMLARKSSLIKKSNNIELLNLIIVLFSLDVDKIQFKDVDIFELVTGLNDSDFNSELMNLSYFEITTILYCKKEGLSGKEYKIVMEQINKKLRAESIFENSECCLIFFDAMACPYIDKEDKIKMISSLIYPDGTNYYSCEQEASKALDGISNGDWFVNWDPNVKIYDLLEKKELKEPYSS